MLASLRRDSKMYSDNITPLYKYTKRKYARDMIRKGVVRIGTLSDFRKYWETNKAIGDRNEGQKTLKNENFTGHGDELPPFAQRFFTLPTDPRDQLYFDNTTFRRSWEDNHYVYC